MATLVERHSRFAMLVRVENKNTGTVVAALTEKVRTLPEGLMSSLTWDRGKEMASHKLFIVATDVQVYFCDPGRKQSSKLAGCGHALHVPAGAFACNEPGWPLLGPEGAAGA